MSDLMKRFLVSIFGSLFVVGLIVGCSKVATNQQRVHPAYEVNRAAPGVAIKSATGLRVGPGKTSLAYGSPDEVWVIEQFTSSHPKEDDYTPRADLVAEDPTTKKLIPIPLKRTVVNAKISMFVAEVNVIQQYTNPYDAKIEATYIFPLPQNSAVTDFLMKIGESSEGFLCI